MKKFTVVLGKCIMRAPGLISEHLYSSGIMFGDRFVLSSYRGSVLCLFLKQL
jgi:hypothetical protein